MQKIILFSILFLLASCLLKNNKKCLNPLGQEVDWYTIFFMPASISELKRKQTFTSK